MSRNETQCPITVTHWQRPSSFSRGPGDGGRPGPAGPGGTRTHYSPITDRVPGRGRRPGRTGPPRDPRNRLGTSRHGNR
eukprot:229933-Hanusia_phi.AAC.1